MIHVARGRLSKQIAGDIGVAQATVKVHRSRAMRKMNARSLPEFGQMAAKLNLMPEKSAPLLALSPSTTRPARHGITSRVTSS